MKTLLTLAAALALAASTPAFAKESPTAAASAAKTPQQNKMTQCNADAGDKKGDDRKQFMKTCLSAGKSSSQQDKMKKCNVDATGKKGDERKAFMKDCLSS